ncbi:hypothetical protein KSS87_001528 [Heliosperma pusillum]|nr:hypothetical protein KSS87_001528 [Heliosperma pusillum]
MSFTFFNFPICSKNLVVIRFEPRNLKLIYNFLNH